MAKKYNLLVPMAGKGQRMIDGGYSFPKPMILAGDRHVLEYGLDSIDYSECNLIFVVRRDHVSNFSIHKFLKLRYGEDIEIIVAEGDTSGSVATCLLAKQFINNNTPLIVFCPDIHFSPKFVPTDEMFEYEGYILTFQANSSNYSYCCIDGDGFVSSTAEKMVISNNASVGVYCFKNGRSFVNLAEQAISSSLKSNNEYYVCPLYNLLIAAGGRVKTHEVPIMYIMGTPAEMKFFMDVIYPFMLPRTFILCSDHSGFEKKEECRMYLEEHGVKYIDVGCYSDDDCDYSDFIEQAVISKRYFPGALILGFCRSGQGVNICANKYRELISALVTTKEAASLAIRHNAANFFAISAGNVSTPVLYDIIEVLRFEKFEGGRHQNRLMKVM